uniref:Uncharacterized protein n=1 Tax=Brassica oleracea TaxID=3712 RepID=A0A3P6D0J1_BRAOL|nr:unnamed protein product [Brassica oleracea]
MIIVKHVDFIFWNDAFKTTKVNVRNSVGVIKGETENSNHEEDGETTRALQECWESCSYSFITSFSGILRINESLVLSL